MGRTSTGRTSAPSNLGGFRFPDQVGPRAQLHLPPRLNAELSPPEAQGDFLLRLEGVEVQTKGAEVLEPMAPEKTLVDRRGLHPDSPAHAPGVFHGGPQQLVRHAQTPVQWVSDDGVNDEPVSRHALKLAVARFVFQQRSETKSRVAGSAAEEPLSRPAGHFVKGELWHRANVGYDAITHPSDDVSRVTSYGELELDFVLSHVVVQDRLDHGPDFILGIHELDGSIQVERVDEDLGHCVHVASLSSKYMDVQPIQHDGHRLDKARPFVETRIA